LENPVCGEHLFSLVIELRAGVFALRITSSPNSPTLLSPVSKKEEKTFGTHVNINRDGGKGKENEN